MDMQLIFLVRLK
ncbi:rCG49751 [Rattus norvegicus]|uniref:RCG49751 n=1 Tax=Rattus norvegicus TaxID=10116 RepID=A6K4T0_RAT|nr:rCG49751 [Rattus norvegicus]